MKVLTVLGARPQFVKAAPVSRALRSQPGVREHIVHTGQHYDESLSDVFFDELALPPPDRHLGVGSAPHGRQTGRMLEALESVLLEEWPTVVLVYGDTNSTLSCALAAVKHHIPVAHVEAGLRSFNRRMPEEINRILTDHCAEILFAPTPTAVENLRREGIPAPRIVLCGDVMYDAALQFAARAERKSAIVARLGLQNQDYVLATVHRAENTDDPQRLNTLLEALGRVSRSLPVVLPLHPRTRAALDAPGSPGLPAGLRILEPVGYLDMVQLERHARVIATDSGGVQKEAFFQRVPCVTLRDETEWVELVDLGWNRLAPPVDAVSVERALLSALATPPPPLADAPHAHPFGDGSAAREICRTLVARFGEPAAV